MLQFKYKLTKRESILLTIAFAVLIFAIYYFVCYKPCKALINSYNTDILIEELNTERIKIKKSRGMENEIEENKKKGVGEVFPYNSLKMEMRILNDIMHSTKSFEIDFEPPIQDEMAVRRGVNISFTTTNYETAKMIIKRLYRCEYRCLIGDVSISSGEKDCSVSVQMTFIESMDGANTDKGLTHLKKTTEENIY